MAFAFFRDRDRDGRAGPPQLPAGGRAVYELDPCDERTSVGTLRVRARQREAQGWTLLGLATAPDGRRYQVWQRTEEEGAGPSGPTAA